MYASSGCQNSYGRLRYVIGSYKMDQPACPDWDRNGMLTSSLPNLLSSFSCLPASYPGFPPTAQSSTYWWRDFWRAAPAKTPRRYVHFRSRKRAENTLLCWQRHLQIAGLTTALFSPISQVLREELEAKQVRYHLGEVLAVLGVPEGSSGSAGLPEGIGRGSSWSCRRSCGVTLSAARLSSPIAAGNVEARVLVCVISSLFLSSSLAQLLPRRKNWLGEDRRTSYQEAVCVMALRILSVYPSAFEGFRVPFRILRYTRLGMFLRITWSCCAGS